MQREPHIISLRELQIRLEDEIRSWPGYQLVRAQISQFPSLDWYLTGGAVRDTVLDRGTASDLDFFIGGNEFDTLLECLARSGRIEVGPLGSPRWYPEGSDDKYCDFVSIRSVNHGLGECFNIEQVLNQFDFTGNAIAYDLRTGEIVDPFHGLLDLSSGIMRAIRFDFPDIPVKHGSLITWRATRWFRILHYAEKLNLSIEPNTLDWIIENAYYYKLANEFGELFFRPSLNIIKKIRDNGIQE